MRGGCRRLSGHGWAVASVVGLQGAAGLWPCQQPQQQSTRLAGRLHPARRCGLDRWRLEQRGTTSVPVSGLPAAMVAASVMGQQFSLLGLFIMAQAFLNIYMKFMMSSVAVAPGAGVYGIPASFLVTGLQQLVAFGLFLALFPVRRLLSRGHERRRLNTREWGFVLCMAFGFALNMGLNNFSLAFIPLSVNQVIRACGPLMTALLQLMVNSAGDRPSRNEWLLMALGVLCAVTTVIARAEGKLASEMGYFFGALLCACSVVCAALDYVLKQMTGTKLKMSSVDAMGYMALPAFFILLLPAFLWRHPVPLHWVSTLEGSGQGPSGTWTDVAVLLKGSELRPELLLFIAISGVLAFLYNALTTFMAVKLSATTASLVGNIPTSTVISLLVLEKQRPRGAWGWLLWAGVAGNVAAFAAYSAVKRRRAAKQAKN